MRRGAPLQFRLAAPLAFAALLFLGVACVPTRGGWDSQSRVRETPALRALSGQRLGDMVPFPGLVASAGPSGSPRLALVVCRFAAGTALRIRSDGPGWSEPAGAAALAALAPLLARLGLSLERTTVTPVEIEIHAHLGLEAEAPEGLGDTLAECDVTNDVSNDLGGEAGLGPRGLVRRADIRMRRSGIDAKGLVQRASDDAWIGALLHELAHALGFSGHAATGRSLLVRDEGVLREIGRAVLQGQPLSDPTLTALYQLRPGQILGERTLSRASANWLRAVLRLDAELEAAGIRRTALVASVGDREARLSFRYANGRGFGLRFPGWPERLRDGGEVFAIPDRAALEAMRAAGGESDERGASDAAESASEGDGPAVSR